MEALQHSAGVTAITGDKDKLPANTLFSDVEVECWLPGTVIGTETTGYILPVGKHTIALSPKSIAKLDALVEDMDIVADAQERFERSIDKEMLKSRSGQMEIAQFLKDVPGAIRTPAQAIQALTTGRVKPIYQSAQAELDLIQWENERLREGTPLQQQQEPVIDSMGQPVIDPKTQMPAVDVYQTTPQIPVITAHDHPAHINEHLIVAYDQNADPEVRNGALQHVLWHFREWQSMPPELALLRGFAPPQAPAPPPGMKPPGDAKPPESMKKDEPPADAASGLPKPARPPQGAAVREA